MKKGELQRNYDLTRRNHRSFRGDAAFTLLELVIVISIIILLAGLTIATMQYVQDKGKRSRAEAEIAAISAALESYKVDNGIYPYTPNTNNLDPGMNFDPATNDLAKYKLACFDLYVALTGDTNGNRIIDSTETAKSYMPLKPSQLYPAAGTVQFIKDPFGNSYGYSTAKNPIANPTPTATPSGYNQTFDLWSTAGGKVATDAPKWVKNW